MVRLVHDGLFIFLPEPDEWRQQQVSSAALAPRALVVLQVESFEVMRLGPTRLAQLDPHGAIAERRGEAAVKLLDSSDRGIIKLEHTKTGQRHAAFEASAPNDPLCGGLFRKLNGRRSRFRGCSSDG